MATSKILALSTVLPPHTAPLADVLPYSARWVQHQDEAFQQKTEKIFKNAQVDCRHSVVSLEHVFSRMTLDEKNALYQTHAVDLSETLLRQALDDAKLNPTDIDCLIVTSCTGHMSPSIDAVLVNRLGMKPSVQRLPVMEMGCMGGAAGLIYAENYLRAYPNHTVALITVELPTITFQHDDYSWANVVSTALFGDGAACAILGPSNTLGPAIVRSAMYHFPDTTHLLGYNLTSTGFSMVLDEALPETIRQHFDQMIAELLDPEGLTLKDIDHFIIHPGGKKILHNIGLVLAAHGKSVDTSKSVLRDCGNLSSATVLFILKRFMDQPVKAGDRGLLLGIGPGLTACSVLLEWGAQP